MALPPAASLISRAPRRAALQSGYVYHYAFAMLIGVVQLSSPGIYMVELAGLIRQADTDEHATWPILSVPGDLPAAGRGCSSFSLFVAKMTRWYARNARYVALWTSLITFFCR